MCRKVKDLTGQKFGNFTVIKYADNSKWLCRCNCGSLRIVRGYALINGLSKSCGCSKKGIHTKHGKCDSRLYTIFTAIKQRCYNKNHQQYYNYGGRGIKMCGEWLSDFMVFYNWSIKHGYQEDLTIDRIDNNKGYSPSNCRWVDRKIQTLNRRCARNITYDGKTKPLIEWCKIFNINYNKVYMRLKYGWSIEKALEVK